MTLHVQYTLGLTLRKHCILRLAVQKQKETKKFNKAVVASEQDNSKNMSEGESLKSWYVYHISLPECQNIQ